MDIAQKINVFVQLGDSINKFSEEQKRALGQMIKLKNEWFTRENLDLTLQGLQQYLNRENLEKWLGKYPSLFAKEAATPKKVGIVMAGNIPAVGFHDLLSVVMSGHILHAKLSSKDQVLMQELIRMLIEIAPELKEQIVITEKLKGIEALIATGSDNSARYFEAYFGHLPHIIRKNRSSVAVLDGKETEAELGLLSNDIFQYFGLGCRNVSKLFVPQEYKFDPFFEAIHPWGETLLMHSKYCNNYEYYRALFLMKKMFVLDNNFLILAEYDSMDSPVGVMFFERYTDEAELKQKLAQHQDKIQVVVSKPGLVHNSVGFGNAQTPHLWDYADGVDTMAFLTRL
ncbi:acyl-CoA reductase [uncultured Microscilla sp.]|uniref:acyl-CoA reductase n=1 Tax=uncultured Microscilla sp. TaxID=432653 RepID=UPI0026023224|nr:acyl-CoA reductase [uncultured Microscilla sp.]